LSDVFAAIYEAEPLVDVVLMSVVIGGACAALTGRAMARAWHSRLYAALAMVPLGAAIRFLHYALYDGTLLSWPAYIADTVFLIVVALFAWQATRARQMVRQYYWLYVPRGPLGWRPRSPEDRGAPAQIEA